MEIKLGVGQLVGEVCELLFQVLENEEDVIIKHGAPSQTNQRLPSQGMHSSKFCLDPLACVPVIVRDRIDLPFENVKRYFEYKDPNGTVNKVWRQVSQKLPLIKLMISCDRRLATMHVTETDCSACLCSNQSGIATTR
ncbi:putative arabinosyltransferase arad1 [Quercus suber]|uniref:Arabinosyltransferase arad1 n=1 Tax=Quercus suber TaxID=58331 RepID=A0AAW0KEW1_QUESU